MSAFLGHIHYWLYNKIKRNIAREKTLVECIDKHFDGLGTELYEAPLSMYGAPIDETKELADIIDHSNIHGWLQEQIARSEIREATFVKDVADTLDTEGTTLLFDTFEKDGIAAGLEAKNSLSSVDANSIYKVMQNYYLNGMPCDGGDTILTTEEAVLAWEGSHKNQALNWSRSGVMPALMSTCYQYWFTGFLKGLETDYEFHVTVGNPPIYSIQK